MSPCQAFSYVGTRFRILWTRYKPPHLPSPPAIQPALPESQVSSLQALEQPPSCLERPFPHPSACCFLLSCRAVLTPFLTNCRLPGTEGPWAPHSTKLLWLTEPTSKGMQGEGSVFLAGLLTAPGGFMHTAAKASSAALWHQPPKSMVPEYRG